MVGRTYAVLILLIALVVTACGGGGGQPSGGQQGAATASPTVNVSEKEWVIDLASKTTKAGKVKFVIKNDGTIEHNFVIKELKLEVSGIQPGQSKEQTVDLKAGTYTIVCDIPGHEEAGMKSTLTVTQ